MAHATPVSLRCEYLSDPLAVDTPHPRLSWILLSDHRAVRQTAYQILVATDGDTLREAARTTSPDAQPHHGDATIAHALLWNSGRVASDQSNHIEYAGPALAAGQCVCWLVRIWTADDAAPSAWSPLATWRVGLLAPADWHAYWIAPPAGPPETPPFPLRPATLLRCSFVLKQAIKRAVATVSALGLYVLRLNGRRVGDHLLAPEWTNYHRRVQYQAYDVTALLQPGDNAAGALLGDGWYAGRIGQSSYLGDNDPLRGFYGRQLALRVQLDVEYTDGQRETIATDDNWKTLADGPIRSACLLDGEVYDARHAPAGWDQPQFDDAAWPRAVVQNVTAGPLVAQPNEPIRITQELQPVATAEPQPGVYVVDFGQNMAGTCRLTIEGPAGTTVRLRHAEMLSDDGNVYRDNLRMVIAGDPYGARQEDRYTLSGDGEEIYAPHFTYHGFRYVEVAFFDANNQQLTKAPGPWNVVARALHSAPPVTGAFECSSPLLNKLIQNITWTQRSNMHSIPSDCPQRDERLGWTGDILVFAQNACFNMDMAAFFTKWVRDLRDAQTDDGRFPDFAPQPFDPTKCFSAAPAWADVGVFLPWTAYVNYGDRRLLAEHFDAARAWVDFVHRHNPDLLWKNRRGHQRDYGDWLNGDTLVLEGYPKGEAEVPRELFSTAFFQRSTALLANMAALLGRSGEAEQYGQLAAAIRQAFNDAYVRPDGTMEGHTQAGYALALAFDLVPDQQRAAVMAHLIDRIRAYHDHISTGFHTTVLMMNELTRGGHVDEAYKLVNQRTVPSWGYSIDQGATTIWERWDGFVVGRGFQDAGMNSFNHYALGAVGEWIYRTILGINPDEQHPAYKHFTLRPLPGGGLTWARGSYASLNGKIACAWNLAGHKLTLDVTIPPNTTATVYVPAASIEAVTEGGRPAAEAPGLRFTGMTLGAAVFEVGSGTYAFESCPLSPERGD